MFNTSIKVSFIFHIREDISDACKHQISLTAQVWGGDFIIVSIKNGSRLGSLAVWKGKHDFDKFGSQRSQFIWWVYFLHFQSLMSSGQPWGQPCQYGYIGTGIIEYLILLHSYFLDKIVFLVFIFKYVIIFLSWEQVCYGSVFLG